MSRKWRSLSEGKPEENEGMVFVWHRYQGVLYVPWDRMHNRFYQYWMPTNGTIRWNDATEIRPTQADADVMGCVLAKDAQDNVRLAGWHAFDASALYTHWAILPEKPKCQ